MPVYKETPQIIKVEAEGTSGVIEFLEKRKEYLKANLNDLSPEEKLFILNEVAALNDFMEQFKEQLANESEPKLK